MLIAVRDHIKAIPREFLQSEFNSSLFIIYFPIIVKITFGVLYRPSNNETKSLEDLQSAPQEIVWGMT